MFTLALDQVPGDSIIAKRLKINSMSADDLKALANVKGAMAVVKPGSICVVPPGMLVVSYAAKPTSVVRWSLCNEAVDGKIVLNTLNMMLQAYPYLEATDYKTLRDALAAK